MAHTDCRTHPEASGFFARAKAAGRDVHHSLPSGAEVTNEWGYIPFLPLHLHGVGRGNFASLFTYLFFVCFCSLPSIIHGRQNAFSVFSSSFIVPINWISARKKTETLAGFYVESWLRVLYLDGNLNDRTFACISQSLQNQTSLTSIHRLPICWLTDWLIDWFEFGFGASQPRCT